LERSGEPPDPNEKAPAVAISNDEGFQTKGLGGHLQEHRYTNLEAVSSQTIKRARQILAEITSPYAWLSDDVQAVIDILDELDGDSDFEDQCEDEGAQCDDEGDKSDDEETTDECNSSCWFEGVICTLDHVQQLAAIWRKQNLGTALPPSKGRVVMFQGTRS
jgi:hypothetical protein